MIMGTVILIPIAVPGLGDDLAVSQEYSFFGGKMDDLAP